MRLVFAGTPATALPSLRALLASRHQVIAALTRPDAPAGRGGRMSASPVTLAAREAGIPLLQPASVRSPAFESEFRALDADAVAVVAFGALIPQRLLEIPRHGWINLHFSLLPAWRGAAPVQAAIRAGDEITGASTFLIEQGLDTGPVYGTVTEPIGPRDTAGAVLDRLATSGAALLVATMDGIADGSLRPVPQPADGVSLAPKITAVDAEIDWQQPAFAIDRMIRSVTPAPGAWTATRWGRLTLGPVEPVAESGLAPGELAAGKRQVLVGAGSGAVRLGTVQAPGKRPMPAADWARGARPAPGERWGDPDAVAPVDASDGPQGGQHS
ncbi:MAG TPA: methionyl-tRNA formyltransferase [Nakamurella sp.]|nr:methionyl-tRNA formyltransferase [Nakamurella sp.]